MITILDCPGHKDFVPNMMNGAAEADAAVMVVDSMKGRFEAGITHALGYQQFGGQTTEHL